MALKHEAVVDNWNVLVIAGAGHGRQVLQQIESMIKEANMPGVILQQRDVSSGLFGAKRNFLVAGHNNLRDYHKPRQNLLYEFGERSRPYPL